MKKKVLMLVANPGFSYENPNSAVAVYLKMLRDSLLRDGFEVTLFPPEKAAVPASIQAPKSSTLKRFLKTLLPGIYNALLAKKLLGSARLETAKLLEYKPDFDLIIEFLVLGSTAGAALKAQWNIPLVIIYDSPLATQFQEMYGSARWMKKKIEQAEQFSVSKADTVICYSDPVKQYLEKVHRKKNGFAVMPCIVWKDRVEERSGKEQWIGFVGSFLKWHKVDLLVKAFERIAPAFPNARLVLVGYGQQWEEVQQQVAKSPFAERIGMTGFVTEAELAQIKSELLIGVMPGSNWYGSPLKLFEYADAGIAIVTAATPTVSDLFTTDEVLFIDPENEEKSLQESLELLLRDEISRNRLIQNARNKMEGVYSKSQQLANFNQLIKNTIQRGTEK